MPISSLNAVTTKPGQQWNAQNTIAGLSSTTGNAGANSKSQTYSNATANNALGGADEYFNYLITISASGTANIDLTNLIDISSDFWDSLWARLAESVSVSVIEFDR